MPRTSGAAAACVATAPTAANPGPNARRKPSPSNPPSAPRPPEEAEKRLNAPKSRSENETIGPVPFSFPEYEMVGATPSDKDTLKLRNPWHAEVNDYELEFPVEDIKRIVRHIDIK